MTERLKRGAMRALVILGIVTVLAGAAFRATAAPYAALVMDARSGEVLYSQNADTRLHPASLTKMMTLYIAFEAVRLGEISLDTEVKISTKAAAEPPSKLGLRPGQKIALRYLIRAAAVKSANDAATAIGEAIEGSEAAFARRMNATARALGMSRTTFKNAHGLTEDGHLSTARDMTILGRQLFYDYPEYYNLFSRRSTHAGIKQVNNTNRRFLDAYKGADGIKTGYTRAAGFNLVASAERGSERIIATVFGGNSTAHRNAKMAELMDLGFRKAPTRVAVNRPQPPRYGSQPGGAAEPVMLASADASAPDLAGKVIRASGAVTRSIRPVPRGSGNPDAPLDATLVAAIESGVAAAISVTGATRAAELAAAELAAAEAVEEALSDADAEAEILAAAEAADAVTEAADSPETSLAEAAEPGPATQAALPAVASIAAAARPPRPRPTVVPEASATQAQPVEVAAADIAPAQAVESAETAPAAAAETEVAAGAPEPAAADSADAVQAAPVVALAADRAEASPQEAEVAEASTQGPVDAVRDGNPGIVPDAGSYPIFFASAAAIMPQLPEPTLRPEPEAPQVVERLSSSGGRHWGVSLGRFPSRFEAEKVLITAALADMTGLGQGLRKIVQRGGGFEANFMGLSEQEAQIACARAEARGRSCTPIGP